MKIMLKIYMLLPIFILATSCSPGFSIKKLSKKIEVENNIEYPVQKNRLFYSKCNIKIRKKFLDNILDKNTNSTNNIFIEYHGTRKIYFVLKTKNNLYYFERNDFLICSSGKELFFSEESDHWIKALINSIMLDLGDNLSYNNLINKSLKNTVSDAKPIYLTVFDINKERKVEIIKTLKFNEYYNPEYDDWPSIE